MTTETKEPTPPKRGRGRPKIVAEQAPLYHLNGTTKEERLSEIFGMWQGCTRCFLGECRQSTGNSEIVFGDGNPEAHVLIVGEAPGAEEESSLVPFVGPAGRLLNQILASVSDDPEIQELVRWFSEEAPRKGREADQASERFHAKIFEWRASEFFITNVVTCRPPENRPPTLPEAKACWERLWNTIYTIDPLLIVACGNEALAAVTQKQTVKITRMRGELFDMEYQGRVGKVSYPVMPVLHPSFLQRAADWRLKDGFYAKTIEDWRSALTLVDILRNRHFNTPIPKR